MWDNVTRIVVIGIGAMVNVWPVSVPILVFAYISAMKVEGRGLEKETKRWTFFLALFPAALFLCGLVFHEEKGRSIGGGIGIESSIFLDVFVLLYLVPCILSFFMVKRDRIFMLACSMFMGLLSACFWFASKVAITGQVH